MTDRDFKILQLLTSIRYATTRQIQEIIFPTVNKSICYKRLSYLINNKLIYRKYFNLGGNSNSYIYYLDKAPKKSIVKHELLVTEFIVQLVKLGHELLEVDKAPIYRGIKPDMIVRMRTKAGKERIIFLEVQLSRHNCIEKYYNLYSGEIPAILYIVTENKLEQPMIRGMRVVIDTLDFKKLSFYFS